MQFLLKTTRNDPAEPMETQEAQDVLKRLRHQGRKLVEVFVLAADGTIDRYQERTRRKLGSNAIASRTWLCETAEGDGWGDGRYIPEPLEAIDDMNPKPTAAVLVLMGAENPQATIEQLQSLPAAT
ncbi:MAG: hypothetical protein H0V47_09580 [Chloroflexia bacterium]|nr:hypothetical protein [Chloroflexia bacterium]